MSEDKVNSDGKSSLEPGDSEENGNELSASTENGNEHFSDPKEEKNTSFDKYLSYLGKSDLSSEKSCSDDTFSEGVFVEAEQKKVRSEGEESGTFVNGQSTEEAEFQSACTKKRYLGESNAFKSSTSYSADKGQSMTFKPQATRKADKGVSFETPDRNNIFCPLWAEMRKPWRKRHPILFWGGFIIIALIGINLALSSLGTIHIGAKKIAQVNIDGIILDSRSTVDWIEKIRKDKAISGVIVRVNSPGGGVTPSQEIYFAIKRLAIEKPVVVSMGTLAASGGYYVSLPAQRIFAVPATVTGSIGVKMELPNVKELFDFLGLSSTTLASGDLKDAGSPLKPLNDKEREYFMGVVMDMFDDFIGVVSMHRKLSVDQVKIVADGRALTGRQALNFGLVDELGDYYDAKNYLYKVCEISGQDRVVIIEGPVKKMSILRELTESLFEIVHEKNLTRAFAPAFLY